MPLNYSPAIAPPAQQRRPALHRIAPAIGPSSSAAFHESIAQVLLLAFLLCLFGRITDFYLANLHIPFILSSLCLLFVPLSPGFATIFANRAGAGILLFTIWAVACVPAAYWRAGSWQVLKEEWFKSFACFVIVAALPNRVDACARILRTMGLAFAAAAAIAILRGTLVDGRLALPVGMYSGPNELAAAMVLGILYLLYTATDLQMSVLRRSLSALMVIPLFWVMLRTGSRGALVCVGMLILMLILRQRLVMRITLLFVSGLVVLLSLVILPNTLKLRYSVLLGHSIEAESVSTDQEADRLIEASGSANQRVQLLKKSLAITLRHPIFGVGPGNFASKENEEARLLGRPKGLWLGTHNTYTQISSEMGIPGLLFFLFCLYGCWSAIRRTESQYRNPQQAWEQRTLHTAYFMRLTLVYYLVLFFFEHIAYGPFWPFLAGLITAFGRSAQAQRRQAAAQPAPAPWTASRTPWRSRPPALAKGTGGLPSVKP